MEEIRCRDVSRFNGGDRVDEKGGDGKEESEGDRLGF